MRHKKMGNKININILAEVRGDIDLNILYSYLKNFMDEYVDYKTLKIEVSDKNETVRMEVVHPHDVITSKKKSK